MKCPFCHVKFQVDNLIEVGRKYSYSVCKHCGGAVLIPQPKREEVHEIYSSDRYFSDLSKPHKNIFIQLLLGIKVFKGQNEWILTEFKKGSVLDVGCGNGIFLNDLKKSGWNVWGSDISKIAVKNTGKLIGPKRVKVGRFTSQRFSGRFDLISFWHVLEHVENPTRYLKKAYYFLKKGSHVVGEVPNFGSLNLRIFKSNYSWLMIPEHRLYFSNKALYEVLKKAGFVSINIFSVPRALLNFSLSLNNILKRKRAPKILRFLFFLVTLPISLGFTFLNSGIKRGEVLRFSARK